MLLVEVRFDRHLAPITLIEIGFLGTLCQFVVRVRAHFDDLSASSAVSQHGAVEDVVKVHLVGIYELGVRYAAELASVLATIVIVNCSRGILILAINSQQVCQVVIGKLLLWHHLRLTAVS